MRTMKVYLDTSVISYINQKDAPERMKETQDIYQAAMLDPHTAAELSVDDIVNMCDELIDAHGDYMKMYR